MAWIASRARKAEIMDKERISEKKVATWIDQGTEEIMNAPAVWRKKTDSENVSTSS